MRRSLGFYAWPLAEVVVRGQTGDLLPYNAFLKIAEDRINVPTDGSRRVLENYSMALQWVHSRMMDENSTNLCLGILCLSLIEVRIPFPKQSRELTDCTSYLNAQVNL